MNLDLVQAQRLIKKAWETTEDDAKKEKMRQAWEILRDLNLAKKEPELDGLSPSTQRRIHRELAFL